MKPEFKIIATLLFAISIPAASQVFAAEGGQQEIPPQQTVQDEPIRLTLEQAIERIKAENPAVLLSRESVRRAMEQTYRERAGLLPEVSIGASQQRQKSRFFGRGQPATFNTFDAGIDASMPLLDAEQYASYKIAQLGVLIEEENFDVALQEVLEQMITQYFTHLRDLRLIELREGDVRRDTELFDVARDQFEAGISTRIDMLRAEQRVRTSERRLLAAKILADRSILQLKALLDLHHDQEVVLEQKIYDGPTGLSQPPDIDRYRAMQVSVVNRPELRAQRKAIEQSQLIRKRAGWQNVPDLSLFGSYGRDTEVIFDGDSEENWLAGIEVSMPIFEGFRIAAEKREADAQVRQNKYAMRDLENQLSSEFVFAVQEIELRYKQIEVASIEEDLAIEEQELESERFKQGLTDNSDLINAQQRRSNAEDTYLDTIYQYGLSRIAFARSVGAVERVLE